MLGKADCIEDPEIEMEQQGEKKLDFDEVQDFVARAQQQGYPLDFVGDLQVGTDAWFRNEIANLEGKASKGRLSDIDAQYLVSLRESLYRKTQGLGPQEPIYIEALLRKKLGSRYNEFVRRRGNHAGEMKRLEVINAELQKEVELAAQIRGGPFPKLPFYGRELDEEPGKGVEVINTMRPIFESLDAASRIDPGTYILEVDENHRLHSFKVEPKTVSRTATALGGKVVPAPVGFWTRVYNWFFLLGRYRFGGSFRNRE